MKMLRLVRGGNIFQDFFFKPFGGPLDVVTLSVGLLTLGLTEKVINL